MRPFTFAVIFILVFAGLLSTVPSGLQGAGAAGNPDTPLDPSTLTDFVSTTDWDPTDFITIVQTTYAYTMTDYWLCEFVVTSDSFNLAQKILWLGLWFGGLDYAEFISDNGTRYDAISFTDLENDAVDGYVRYDMTLTTSGTSAGSLIFYWNTTLYADPSDAWDNDVLYFLHGIGVATNTDIVPLLLSLIFLQLPDCPFLINLLLATPFYACIVIIAYLLILKAIPLVG